MKKVFLPFCCLIPIISYAQPEWELINAFVVKEQIAKVYLDKNSLKSKDNDIRSFDLKMIEPDGKKNSQRIYNGTIMCSRGLSITPLVNITKTADGSVKTSTRYDWSNIFDRTTIMVNIVTAERLAFHAVCADRFRNDANTIEFNNKPVGYFGPDQIHPPKWE